MKSCLEGYIVGIRIDPGPNIDLNAQFKKCTVRCKYRVKLQSSLWVKHLQLHELPDIFFWVTK